MVILHIYARWYLLRARRRYLHRRRERATQIIFYVDPASTVPSRGLDASLLNSLPTFSYSTHTHPGPPLECAVCLSEFEENEIGRQLPTCHHSFHIDCIDMWFHSHSTCPICRTTVEPLDKNHPTESEPVLLTEPGSSSGLAERRKGLDVRIEVPRRNEFDNESRPGSPIAHEFRSPGARLLSLRRILSMNRRTTAISPSPSAETPYRRSESDMEVGPIESTRGHSRTQTPR